MMKYANRCKHKMQNMHKITYLSLIGIHYEYVNCKDIARVMKYAEIEASMIGAIVADISKSSLPKNLNRDESFTNL